MKRTSRFPCRTVFFILVAGALMAWGGAEGQGGELHVGGASMSITPDGPVPLSGQMHTRIAREVESPVTATALALESRQGDKVLDQVLLVACDLVAIREGIIEPVRERLRKRLPDFDARKLILSASHTHTAPETRDGVYDLPSEGVIRPFEYRAFVIDRLTEAAVQAWKSRKPGQAGWGLGHAVVAQNRRAVYADEHAEMYGKTEGPNFRRIEGYEDHGVEVLFFWDREQRLLATAINVACPSQEVENGSAVNADFWHEVREQLRARHGRDLLVLAWTGAAGDQSPHLMIRKAAEERMRTLRGLTRLQELARRVVQAWDEAYEGARKEIHADLPLVHQVQPVELPKRQVTEKEYTDAKKQVETLSKDPSKRTRVVWNQGVVDRYERQQAGSVPPYTMELHVVRLGDVAIATNDFELYTDFGIEIKARSRALQTFVIQLAGPGTYVPTERAVRGGSYSAIVQSNLVGPEGGQVLVERTLEVINALWPDR